jgi:hypothetical protein
MSTIEGIVCNGRIEVAGPLDLPEGTKLLISVPEPVPTHKLDTDSGSPEAIEAWIRWFDALEPLEFTDEERAAWEKARHEQRAYELANDEERWKRIEGLLP